MCGATVWSNEVTGATEILNIDKTPTLRHLNYDVAFGSARPLKVAFVSRHLRDEFLSFVHHRQREHYFTSLRLI